MDLVYNAEGKIKAAYPQGAPTGISPILTITDVPTDLLNTMAVISPATNMPKYYIKSGALYDDPNWTAPAVTSPII